MSIELYYISGKDVDQLELSNQEIIEAVEKSLIAQGKKQTVIEPRVHLIPNPDYLGHFNVLRGYIEPLNVAGVKVVGDYVNNYKKGLPSEMALLNLHDPSTGQPIAIMDATKITEMRTGALTAIGAKYLARKDCKILGHLGARGTSWWNIVLLDEIFNFEHIRVNSRRPESRNDFAKRLSKFLDKEVIPVSNSEDCLKNADIMVEATRLVEPQVLLKTEWVNPGTFVVPYGTISAVDHKLTDVMDKILVDDWGQCKSGKFGSLRWHVDNEKLTEKTLHGELCDVIIGNKAGRENDKENILFWHRGLSINDIALGQLIFNKAKEKNIGTVLPYR